MFLLLIIATGFASCNRNAGIPTTSTPDVSSETQNDESDNFYTNDEYGFTVAFPFEYGESVTVVDGADTSSSDRKTFDITAPEYGIGRIAAIEALPIGVYSQSEYEARDQPFVYIGSNNAYDFVFVRSSDLALDPVTEENSNAYLSIRDSLETGKYEITFSSK
jgi:hypothetical protein